MIALALIVDAGFVLASTVSYGYDELDRLVLVRYDATNMIYYSYDEAGNRTRMLRIGADNPDIDSDGDALKDRWELDWFSNLDQSGTDDPDGDGASNDHEEGAGTNPTNALSVFQATGLQTLSGDEIVIRWSSVAGKYYDLDRATNLVETTPWHPLTNDLPATPTENTYTDQVDGVGPFFYRIKVEE